MGIGTHLESRLRGTDVPIQKAASFESEASDVLQRLRTSLAEVIASVPGPIVKPAELQRALKIDMKLSCKVFKVVSASGSLAAGPHVPGLGALRTFLNAARKAGVQETLLGAATDAASQFDRLVASHAGDRTAFDSMISSFAGTDDAAAITLQHRRATFRGQRHIFGVQARLQVQCIVAQPAEDPRFLDLARITGFQSLRQLRPNAPLVIASACATNDDGTVRDTHIEPLDPTADPSSSIALINQFCSQPPPQFRAVQRAPGAIRRVLVSDGVGKKAAITCVEGHVARGVVPRYREPENTTGAAIASIRMPCEGLLLDLLVREDTFQPFEPRVYACGEHLGELAGPGASTELQRLEPLETVSYLGRGPSVLYAAEFPRYAALGQYVFDRLGWDASRFDVYRCRVEYPVLPSTVVMAFDLPEAPAE